MSGDRVTGASFSSAFSIILSLSRERVAELGCAPIGEDARAFVHRGGLRRLENEAANVAIARIRQAAYPLIFNLFGSEMPRGKERNLVLTRLGQDLARIEKALAQTPATHGFRSARTKIRSRPPPPVLKRTSAKGRTK
jgi:hypothetical protein